KPAWSVPCFFVAKKFRGRGVTRALLEAAVRFARKKGAKLLEGYPVDAKNRQADAFLWWGAASAFRKAGFSEALRRSPTRPIMRREV
ncbi:MAG: GNAT family N-acetyltransferase, partial [Elusimicrobia bacterium]|nr:GNAT family N-acetyltransferase [Elusimicrobiota bacterium]